MPSVIGRRVQLDKQTFTIVGVGIRMALGARPRDIVRTIGGRGITLVAAGLGLGLLGSLGFTQVTKNLAIRREGRRQHRLCGDGSPAGARFPPCVLSSS